MSDRVQDIVGWLRRRLNGAGARGFVVGLSGGIDSAVVARLAQTAAPGQVVGVILPCHSDPQDEADARMVATEFNIPTVRIDLGPSYDQLVSDARDALMELSAELKRAPTSGTDPRSRVPIANIKPRLRMTTLYFLANSLDYLVVGTGNRSELTIGYYTKHGDGGVDLLPIGHLLKSEVRTVARQLGVPHSIIDKPPSAGLWIGQTDEEEMGVTYADLEGYLSGGPDGVAPALAMRLERMIRASEHKRAAPPMPE